MHAIRSFIFKMPEELPLLPLSLRVLLDLLFLHLEVHLELLHPSKLGLDNNDEDCDQNDPGQGQDTRQNQQQQSKRGRNYCHILKMVILFLDLRNSPEQKRRQTGWSWVICLGSRWRGDTTGQLNSEGEE